MEADGDVMDYIDLDSDANVVDSVSTPNRNSDIELHVGMKFSTIDEVQNAYAQYGKARGFQIRVRNSRDKIVQFVCYREGFPFLGHKYKKLFDNPNLDSARETKSGKCGCRASLYCSLDSSSNNWKITKFCAEHNHEMVTPKSCKFLVKHRKLSSSARLLCEVFESEGIAVGKVVNILNPNWEDSEFTKRDCYNYMCSVRKQILEYGDAQAVHDYCKRQQESDSNFRFAIQLDVEDRMLNFFWVDARSRAAYQIFGDVVSFDTTYKTNKYSMPFAPFVGLDNHMHTILFGCVLQQDETKSTFTWLFDAWLNSMDGKTPSAILTDQDIAMTNAITKVFPTSRHRLCVWHIKKKFPERLSHIYHDKSNFKSRINKYIRESLSIEEFEVSWKRLVAEYGVDNNDWLSYLYSIRHKWVPIYCKDIFFAGMNTTGRSESINSFFDKSSVLVSHT